MRQGACGGRVTGGAGGHEDTGTGGVGRHEDTGTRCTRTHEGGARGGVETSLSS